MRRIEYGINWTWYYASTKAAAVEYFRELTGAYPNYDWVIQRMGNGEYAFRLHN